MRTKAKIWMATSTLNSIKFLQINTASMEMRMLMCTWLGMQRGPFRVVRIRTPISSIPSSKPSVQLSEVPKSKSRARTWRWNNCRRPLYPKTLSLRWPRQRAVTGKSSRKLMRICRQEKRRVSKETSESLSSFNLSKPGCSWIFRNS